MDETTPLRLNPDLGLPGHGPDDGSLARHKDIVDFDPAGDHENPLEWPQSYKWGVVGLLTCMAFTVTFTCSSVVPVATRIVQDLDGAQSSKSASVLLVTIWELGESAGPLVIAPLSEIFGRYPVMNVCNVLFIAATLLAVLSQSSALFVTARALTGLAVASNVLGPAIVGDIFVTEQRGSAMSFIQLAPLMGGAVGPAIAGAIAETLGWRQVLWASIILATACEVAFLLLFRETYKVPILRRRAARLRMETGNDALKTVFDLDQQTKARQFWSSIIRPFTVFFSSGVLQAASLFGAMVFSYFYIMTTTLPDILEIEYGLSPALTGFVFIFFSLGSLVTVIICNLTLDKIYIRLRKQNDGQGWPEFRLPYVIAGGLCLPPVIAFYGWIPALRLPLSFEFLAMSLLGFVLMFAFLPLMTYVVDAFGIHSASAITALIVTRCLMGTFLPLATEPLVEHFGYGWGFTIIGGLLLALAPIPVLLYKCGQSWRQHSVYSRDS